MDMNQTGFFLESRSGARHHTFGILIEFGNETAYLCFKSGGTNVRYDIRNLVSCELRGLGERGPVTDETRARRGDADGGKPDTTGLAELHDIHNNTGLSTGPTVVVKSKPDVTGHFRFQGQTYSETFESNRAACDELQSRGFTHVISATSPDQLQESEFYVESQN